MQNIIAFFNILFEFVQTFCPICQKVSECPMQKTILAAVQATDKRLHLGI